MLVHVIDIAAVDGRNPLEDFKIINNELKSYSKKLASLLQIVVLNKMDLLFDDFSKLEEFKKKYGKKYKIIEVSAATHTGLDELLDTIIKNLETLPTSEPDEVETFDFDVKDKTFFEVNIDEDGVFVVSGGLIDEMIRGIVLTDTQSFAYFQKRLKQDGIIKRLKEMGIQENDLVRIGYVEFEYSD